jgi:hypothetical protein
MQSEFVAVLIRQHERDKNMRGKLYEYAVLFHPKLSASKVMEGLGAGEIEAKKSELLVPPKCVVAESEEEVRILASRDVPEKYTKKIDQLEIVVRTFVEP